MRSRVLRVAPLLFGSGFTALVYQTVWMRELRLVFGFSTAASAAVAAIFLGGIGLGSALLGRRANRNERPLFFYGQLEFAIAATAALTPGLVWLARELYTVLGGSFRLGLAVGTLLRLVLSGLVLCLPTVLMGGSLPAATRAVESDDDPDRRALAFLYGSNTLGAVTGALLATFFLLERYGNRDSLWLACLVNALVAVLALRMGQERLFFARETPRDPGGPEPVPASASRRGLPPRRLILAAAAIVGFVFLLMELVWYRMLSPLLGGSTYTFGLILAVALLGIGIGAAAYSLFGHRSASLAALAATCGIEAALLALPFALGDFVAILAVLRRPMGALGFFGHVLGWTEVTGLVVFPAALLAGYQFPLLVGLLGRGRSNVAEDVGMAYAWNTGGAILGSLAGGFGLIPLLSAPGAWRFSVLLLAALGVALAGIASSRGERWGRLLVPAGAITASLLLLGARGPTAAWRHSPIGAGRVDLPGSSFNRLRSWVRTERRQLRWQADGLESSVGILALELGYSFSVNGKIDGSAVGDAPTQVMGGVLGAALHPLPKRALVIGLGTGSTAGWLGSIPSIERVDVVELEPAILHVARMCAPVNRRVLENPKVRVLIGDGRELLLTSRDRYDVIFSEPSNPYRAGISSLFTREFYRAVSSRLAPGGIFIQWLQAYEVDSQTVRTVYATLGSAFPRIETWFSKKDDLLLVASAQPLRYPADVLRERVRQEPYRGALLSAWRVADLEGLLSHYLARDSLAAMIAKVENGRVNTDDANLVEFGFARNVGRGGLFESDDLRAVSRARGEDRPSVEGAVDWDGVDRQRLATLAAEGVEAAAVLRSPLWDRRGAVFSHFVGGRLGQVRDAWQGDSWTPAGALELAMVGEALADGGSEAALAFAKQLQALQPAEANAIVARFLWTRSDWKGCLEATRAAFQSYREDPWPLPFVMKRLLAIAISLPSKDPSLSSRVDELLATPFSVSLLEEERLFGRLSVARPLGALAVAAALQPFEPDFPWEGSMLGERARVYQETRDPKASVARRELEQYLAREPVPFSNALPVP